MDCPAVEGGGRRGTVTCSQCLQPGHNSRKCPMLPRNTSVTCSICNQVGHNCRTCPHRGSRKAPKVRICCEHPVLHQFGTQASSIRLKCMTVKRMHRSVVFVQHFAAGCACALSQVTAPATLPRCNVRTISTTCSVFTQLCNKKLRR